MIIDATASLAERCSRLQLTVPGAAAALRLLDVISKVVPTFQIHRDRRYIVIDPHGLEVSVQFDITTETRHFQMQLRRPDFIQCVVGMNGEMASMRTLAPRSFALDSLILSNRSERDALDRSRDSCLAQLVMSLILERLEVAGERSLPDELLDVKGQAWPAESLNISV